MNVRFLPSAEKYIKKLKDKELRRKFKDEVLEISKNPERGEAKTGDLSGVRSCDIYHNKTNYELAYCITKVADETIVIIMAGTRENFYDELKRYWKKQKRTVSGA